ncbi:ARM repeat-containing protein [Wolfiporia cocos MD-104 SS10]|uniref:ARM repeat-containing protein n=1 Tax=Wolfiporia cocos (strain MD-104) TaxID=742152 RepID=A0A2H3J0H3_WOLCO|nr:ARM repeat-containing protein [Wolfiporia cocos MD-104 SS10]
MGKSEIESWIASTSTVSDEFDESQSDWHREDVLLDWPKAWQVARTQLLSSSTKKRVQFLREELLFVAKHADLSLSQTLDVFKLMTLTYSRYVDTPSREAVAAVGEELVRRDEMRGRPEGEPNESPLGVTEQVIGWLSNEVGQIAKCASAHAAVDMFVLLEWCCGLYTVCLKCNPEFTSTPSWSALIGIMAQLTDMLFNPLTRAKSSIQKSALSRTRRTLRSSPEQISSVIAALLSRAKSSPSALFVVPLLGTCVDVKIRLKNVKDESLKTLDPQLKDDIVAFYASYVLMSKSTVPTHTATALHDFIQVFVTEEDLTATILPTMEKALLRSPEISLVVVTQFFQAYAHSVESAAFRKLLTSILSSAKSANPVTRTNCTLLLKAVVGKVDSANDVEFTVQELLALPKAGKTAGPDHRIALYTMLGYLKPSSTVSVAVVQAGIPLLAKETHDTATTVLASALVPHFASCLREGVALPADTLAVVAKEMGSTKPVVRRALCTLVADVFWQADELQTDAARAVAKALLPALETSLKTVAAGPLTSVAGPLEGYTALVVLLGPYARSGQFDDAIARNVTLQGILNTGTKPSFLLWEKVYRKLVGADDEMWLLRAAEATLAFYKNELTRNEQACTMMGLIFLHLAAESRESQIRRATIAALEALAGKLPELVVKIVNASLTAYLTKGPVQSKASNGVTDETETVTRTEGRLAAFILSAASFSDDCTEPVRRESLTKLVVSAHHPALDASSRQVWIEMCQKARIDLHDLVREKVEQLLHNILSTLQVEAKTYNAEFADSGYRAITTAVFVAPEVVLPRVIEQLKADINPDEINALTQMDIGVWSTPEGQTYVDVLSSKKTEEPVKRGRGYEDAQWEAEVRKSLANKKGTAQATLSKQDLALVQAQLDKESKIRQRVALVKAKLERGLHLVHSLVAARVEELRTYLSSTSSLLLRGAFDKATTLVGFASFERYLELAQVCSDRLETFRTWIGVATLRSLAVEGIPEDFQVEPLNALVLRVLYRLRTLSEQSPLDAATFSYASPLLSQVLIKGGIAIAEDDDPLEQVALAVDILKFHAGEFSDATFPRSRTMEDLLHVIKSQPKLAKDASSALIDIGQSMHTNATRDEINVLLRGTLQQEVYVRNPCLQTLQPFDLTDLDWSPELWIACHDDDEQNARLARHVWEDNGLDVPEQFIQDQLKFLEHENAYVRSSCAASLADAVINYWPQSIATVLNALQDFYREKAKVLAPEFDGYGMVIASSLDRADPWPARVAIARTFELLAPAFPGEEVEPFFTFLIQAEALGDRHADVRRNMLNAGIAVIDDHGSTRLAGLIGMFEAHLSGASPATESADHIKEAVVILFGRVARHLDPSDPRVPQIVERLVEALKTPAEQVQIAVSDCLAALVKMMQTPVTSLVDRLMDELFNAPKYAARRGAAYGLAGVVKGSGISAMKEFNIIERLKSAAEDKKRYEPRQGTMFALETFSNTLGRLFEPYVIHILPMLLTSFGDSTHDVREATHDAARVIMANMSGFGVKTILPSLLSGLDEKQWRSKKGSIELLGMMAYCAPKQLSQSLPIIIPRLTDVLTDSHAQVRAAANKSLKQFGEVISNPEIQSLVPVFLKAMVDPAKTPSALSALLKTSFMHYIDHSSLALVVPIIERGLRERSADIKRKAAQIVGNLASLTDSKDFVPYLSQLLPLVHVVLVDPVPEARATAAKALGTLVERLGEMHFPDLVPGLLRTLKTDTSGVDRQGAAQGLSEVLSGLGMERMEGLLPDIIVNAQSPRSTVREGFMSLLVFLPATFGTRFQPHLPKIVPPILNGLSDAEDYVREAAMRAGRMIVTNYSSKAIDLLLPELERGMFDSGWRIRQSSITLVGELLFKVSGISGKAEIEEDEEMADTAMAESSRKALVEVLGAERRDRILSALYLARQDAVHAVRQSSIHIWKVLVHNTPRTVREILPELLGQIISLLAGGEVDQQETAARTVAELSRKSGERILGEVVAILKSKSSSTDPKTREGACLTLCELMEGTTDGQREGHEDEIIGMVRAALVDDEANVRTAAARAFDILQEHIGAKAIDQTIPTLLEALRQPGQSSGTALQALKEVMNVRASSVFPVLIPTLTAIPMTVFNARALASLVTVAGTALSKRLTVVLAAFAKVRESSDVETDEELKSAVAEAIRALLGSICDPEGLNTLMLLLLGWAKHETVPRRVTACELFAVFCEESELDSSLYRVDWIRQLVSLMDDGQVTVHTAAQQSLDVFVKSVPKDELEPLVVPLRRTIESTGAPGRHVPGFSLPKGIAPMVPIVIAGLTTGSNEQREQAAYAIGDLVERTEENAVKPFVVPFTGPLIRVATQATALPPAVKTAILVALGTMLARIPAFVRPFFPQLQRTFVKSAGDPASLAVRSRAAHALGMLMRNQPRVDPVVTELIAGARGSDDAVAGSFVFALAHVVSAAGNNIGEKARDSCVELVAEAFRETHDESYNRSVASLFAALSNQPQSIKPIVQANLLAGTPPSVLASHCILAVLSPDEDLGLSEETPRLFRTLDVAQSVTQKVNESAANERPSVARPAREARDLLKTMEDM